MNPGQFVPHSTLATPIGTPNTTRQEPSTKIGLPITSLTPLQTSFRNPSSKLTFVGDITPIFPEEMPPLDVFLERNGKPP
jgi:hypothetical protein